MGTYCGIDVGERSSSPRPSRSTHARVVEAQFAETASIDEVIGWVADRGAEASVGVDDPPGPNLGFLADPEKRQKLGITKPPKNTDRRVADYQLGIGGWYSTPSSEARRARPGCGRVSRSIASWRGGTGVQIDRGDGGAIFEIDPTTASAITLGVEHNGDPLEV